MKSIKFTTILLGSLLIAGCTDESTRKIAEKPECLVPEAGSLALANGGILDVKKYESVSKLRGGLYGNKCLVTGFDGVVKISNPDLLEDVTGVISVTTSVRKYRPKPQLSTPNGIVWQNHNRLPIRSAYTADKTGRQRLLVKFADSKESAYFLRCSSVEAGLNLIDYSLSQLPEKCVLDLDKWGAQGTIHFDSSELSRLSSGIVEEFVQKVVHSLEPPVEVLEGSSYFKYPPGSRKPRLYFTADESIAVDLYCGCDDSCEVPDRWYSPETSRVSIQRYGYGRTVVRKVENLNSSRVISYNACPL